MKFEPEDFVVEEITPSGEVLEVGKKISRENETEADPYFTQFILQKRLWTTSNAIRELARRLRVSQKRFNFAGNKDRNAVTVQKCSAFCVPPPQLVELNIKDLDILGAWKTKEKVRLGQLAGNRFTIRLDSRQTPAKEVQARAEQLNLAIPNFFGEQRFGSVRRNTHVIGKLLLQGKHEEAILGYLCAQDGEGEKDEEARKARERLAETGDYAQALRHFPMHLKLERTLLGHLAKYPNDFLGAFRKLHRSLQLLFIHAYQSHLFNKLLEKRVKEKNRFVAERGDEYAPLTSLGFPDLDQCKDIKNEEEKQVARTLVREQKAVLVGKLIGYESELKEEEERVLAEEGVTQEQFLLKRLPELSVKGSRRPLFVFLKGFQAREEGEKTVLRFSLPSGSYATVALKALGIE